MRFPALPQWKSKPVELMKWLIKESQAQLSPRPSVMGLLNWDAAGVTEAALLVCPLIFGPFQCPPEVP